jgi:probable HAF family extracellular repeat protein
VATVALVTLAAAAGRAGATRPPPWQRAQADMERYRLVDLGTLGGNFSAARGINNRGWVSGASYLPGNKVFHATLWRAGLKTDLGTLGGPSSYVNGPVKNDRGEIAGVSEIAQSDPYSENFCSFGGSNLCLGFRWRNGAMTKLPTLGGNNGQAEGVNNGGQVVGWAETSTQDSTCYPPQLFDYYGVIWQPNGKTLTLPPYAGDTVSFATAINNNGLAVGASGSCGPLNYQPIAAHALLWQGGSTIDLGNLGGTDNNVPFAINNRGQVAGYANLSGDTTSHAFLWKNGVMSDLGTLSGDVFSQAQGMNDKGQVVGVSCGTDNNCRAFLWQNGSMTDLNLLVPPHSRLYLTRGEDINDSGQIAADGVDAKGHQRAVTLIPAEEAGVVPKGTSARSVISPKTPRMQLRASGVSGQFFPGS